jgi:beta-glucanase (GH16 family)
MPIYPAWNSIYRQLNLKCVKTLALAGFLATVSHAAPNGYTVYWADEFNLGVGKQGNSAYWTYDLGNNGWGNNELENYTNSYANTHIISDPDATDGLAMQIQAIETGTNTYTSTRMKTEGHIVPKYGFIEARLKIPYGQGIWPAFWMLGSNINSVGWPACGENDIMENIGSVLNTNYGSLHAPNFNSTADYVLPSPTVLHTDYHLFQTSWTPNNISFLVDGNAYGNENINNDAAWPFNEPMFFIMNVAVGGNWPGSPNSSTIFPQTLLADYIRVYHLTGPTSNEVVSFFNVVNNKFITAENQGDSPLDARATVAQGWEQYLVVDLGANTVALLSQANNKFVTVATTASSAIPLNSLIANSSTVTAAAKFQWLPNSDGTVYLKSLANNKYVSINTSTSPASVVASSSTAGPNQELGVTCYGQLAAPLAPPTPQKFAAKAGLNNVVLSWQAVSGATSYQIYKTNLPGGSGMAPLTTVTGTSYTVPSLAAGKPLSFTVTALNSQGMSLRSTVATVTPY